MKSKRDKKKFTRLLVEEAPKALSKYAIAPFGLFAICEF